MQKNTIVSLFTKNIDFVNESVVEGPKLFISRSSQQFWLNEAITRRILRINRANKVEITTIESGSFSQKVTFILNADGNSGEWWS